MTRGKKVRSKTSQSTSGDLCKALRFVTEDRSGEESGGAKNFDVLQDMSEDTTSRQTEGQHEVTTSIRT